ncbi:GNAT family N-acetyltransferase [Nocardia niwae]|uniref:GNAT family N-acetyltransferase n=1 Tax=Nocardia niwae TaxID=626084 RepID=A0ABV2XEG4_9NOCA
MRTAAAHRGRGVASALLRHVIAEATARRSVTTVPIRTACS